MSLLPIWARKPNHEKEVIATEKGWTVKETGEVLRSDKHLLSKLDTLNKEMEDIQNVQQDSNETVKPEPDTTLEDNDNETSGEPEKPTEKQESEATVQGTEKELTAEELEEAIKSETKPEEQPKKKKPGRPKKSESNKNS